MKKNLKLIICNIIVCILVFFVPFILKNENDSLNSVISTAFTAVGATATLITMIIALSLYQKYGMDSKLVEKQTDKVFELIDTLKGKSLTIHTGKISFYLRFNNIEEEIKNDPFFNTMYPKKITINDQDYEQFLEPIQNFMRSYLLPDEIKENLKFLELYALADEYNFNYEEYVKMTYESKTDEEFLLMIPFRTVEEFIDGKNKLVDSINDWLSKHTSIKLNLELEKPS